MLAATVLAAVAAGLEARPAAAEPGLIVGATDDMFKLEPGLSRSVAQDLGLRATRVSIHWHWGQTQIGSGDVMELQNAVSTGVRVTLGVWGWKGAPPQDAASRDAYCSFVRNALEQVPEINDVVIWNEPNLSLFWDPQFDADGSSASPAAYQALLARCWDVLHALRPNVNVIGLALCPWGSDTSDNSVTISHSPVMFIRKLGEAYRASGRTKPIFDTIGHHIYGQSPGERPWREHPYSRRVSQGDLGKLVKVLQDAFGGTRQPVPGMPVEGRSAPIWYLEAGFETTPDAEQRPLYANAEPPGALPDSLGALPWTMLPEAASTAPDQETQLRDAVRLAYCQPYVEVFLNFLLRDQEDLTLWQSGVLWADRTPKSSYAAFRDVVAEVSRGTVDCSLFAPALTQASIPPAAGSTVAAGSTAPKSLLADGLVDSGPAAAAARATPRGLAVTWVRRVRSLYSRRNVRWGVSVRATLSARYVAAVVDNRGRRTLASRGTLAKGRVTPIRFPRKRLAGGKYRVVLRVTAPQALSLRSRSFRVR